MSESIYLSLTDCNNKDMRAASSYILYSVFTHSIAAARLLFNLKKPIMKKLNSNSVNEVKNAKAVQVIDFNDAFDIYESIEASINSFGGLGYVMELTKNFAYSLSESKVNESDLPAVKVGKKSYYLSPVGKVNQANVLNVIKSILKIEDAKRVLAKKLAKRLTFEQFAALNDTQKRISDMKAGLKLVNVEMTAKQEKDALHSFYNEYLQSLGLYE